MVRRKGTNRADSIRACPEQGEGACPEQREGACPDLEGLNTVRLAEGGFISISNVSGSDMSGARLEGSPQARTSGRRISDPPLLPYRPSPRRRSGALLDGHACDSEVSVLASPASYFKSVTSSII